MSWSRGDGPGFELFSNRDERRTRARAEPPRRYERDGVAWLAPRDVEGGGTWIGVNDRGVALTLLNLYEADAPGRGGARSRGLLVDDLMTSASAAEVAQRLEGLDLAPYRPFTLLALDRDEETIRRWNGVGLQPFEPAWVPLLTSSGHDAAMADLARRQLWARASVRGPLAGDALARLHKSHQPARGPLSPCMHRPEAETVSFTRIDIKGDAARLRYAPGAPCVTRVAAALTLALR